MMAWGCLSNGCTREGRSWDLTYVMACGGCEHRGVYTIVVLEGSLSWDFDICEVGRASIMEVV